MGSGGGGGGRWRGHGVVQLVVGNCADILEDFGTARGSSRVSGDLKKV